MDMYMDSFASTPFQSNSQSMQIPMTWEESTMIDAATNVLPNAVYIKELEKAINDELHAIHFYAKLIELAPDQRDKQRISQIRQDEIRHYHQFYRHYMQLTGKHPQLQPGQTPKDFENGLNQAIEDELQAVAFYQRMMQLATDPRIRNMWMHTAQDEQRHAAWLMLIKIQDRKSHSGEMK